MISKILEKLKKILIIVKTKITILIVIFSCIIEKTKDD